jgi:hypothetical protein
LESAAEGSRDPTRLLLEVMTASEKITEELSALAKGLEDLVRGKRGAE